MRKGQVFGFDLMLSFIVTCSIVYLMFLSLNQLVEERTSLMKEEELEQKTILFMDSLVKNSSAESPWGGAAYFDPKLKRVRANVLSQGLLSKISESAPKEVKKIYLKKGNESFLDRKTGKDCIGIERIVLIRKELVLEKNLLGAVVCSE